MSITGKNHLGCQWTQEEKCGLMEGPCSDDSHCLFDLICEANSCNEDFSNGTRCCTQPLPCNHTHARTDTCCNELHKCNINEGNCYDNNGCYGNLQCGTKNCDWSSEANCCTHPSNEGGKWPGFFSDTVIIKVIFYNSSTLKYLIDEYSPNYMQCLPPNSCQS